MMELTVLGIPGYSVMKQKLDRKDCVPQTLWGWKVQRCLGKSWEFLFWDLLLE